LIRCCGDLTVAFPAKTLIDLITGDSNQHRDAAGSRSQPTEPRREGRPDQGAVRTACCGRATDCGTGGEARRTTEDRKPIIRPGPIHGSTRWLTATLSWPRRSPSPGCGSGKTGTNPFADTAAAVTLQARGLARWVRRPLPSGGTLSPHNQSPAAHLGAGEGAEPPLPSLLTAARAAQSWMETGLADRPAPAVEGSPVREPVIDWLPKTRSLAGEPSGSNAAPSARSEPRGASLWG
jgi:hypothetical protein